MIEFSFDAPLFENVPPNAAAPLPVELTAQSSAVAKLVNEPTWWLRELIAFCPPTYQLLVTLTFVSPVPTENITEPKSSLL